MANVLHADVLDSGLNVMNNLADSIYIVSADPTTFAEATATFALGHKTFAIGAAVGNPSAGAPNGRTVATTAITDGSVTANGTALGWAIVDTANQKLYANGRLSGSQAVLSGNAFTLASFDIRIPNQ